MAKIKRLSALEILDSRGRPTIEVTCELVGGAVASAQVPSGASTGKAEAVELRDGDPRRFGGRGCRQAAANVSGPIAAAVTGGEIEHQEALDRMLIDLDGTPNKAIFGANSILGVSIAFARAVAVERGVPLYQQFADLLGLPLANIPRLTINLFSGGRHAGGQVAVQDALVVPASAATIDEGLSQVCAVYEAAAQLNHEKYGTRRLSADEGGLAPPFERIEAMFDDAVAAITAAGLSPNADVCLAIDVASSHFFEQGAYRLSDVPISATEMIDTIDRWVEQYPIVSVEDGLAEEDWQHWPALRERLSGRALTLGDDLLCTNVERIARAIDERACNALLLKVNQIGTLTEAAEALKLARGAGWKVTVSARSGETEDNWLADLAVGWSADQIKVGSVTQSERLAKYNRLLAIESATTLPVVNWPSR
jgi:enolase